MGTPSIVQAILSPSIFMKGRRLGKEFARHMQPGQRVLDFGCGDFVVGRCIANNVAVRIEGVDTTNYNMTDLPLTVYNGSRLPFEDNTFDHVVACFVLHHCDNPQAALEECARVSKRSVLLSEEVCDTPIRSYITRTLCFMGNHIESWNVKNPQNFKSTAGWNQTFNELGLELVSARRVYQWPVYYPTHQWLFELNKTGSGKHADDKATGVPK